MNRRNPIHYFSGFVLWILVGLPSGPVSAAPIEIKKELPLITRRIYDPQHRPDDGPIFSPSEAGVCVSNFSIRCATEAESVGPSAPRVKSISIVLGLEITIWLLPDSLSKTQRHEEGHRQISEAYYRDAEIIARAIAAELTAIPLPLAPQASHAALEAALHRLDNLVTEKYLDSVSRSATRAQENFDRLTAHGTNSVPEDEGITRAMTEERRSRTGRASIGVPSLP